MACLTFSFFLLFLFLVDLGIFKRWRAILGRSRSSRNAQTPTTETIGFRTLRRRRRNRSTKIHDRPTKTPVLNWSNWRWWLPASQQNPSHGTQWSHSRRRLWPMPPSNATAKTKLPSAAGWASSRRWVTAKRIIRCTWCPDLLHPAAAWSITFHPEKSVSADHRIPSNTARFESARKWHSTATLLFQNEHVISFRATPKPQTDSNSGPTGQPDRNRRMLFSSAATETVPGQNLIQH